MSRNRTRYSVFTIQSGAQEFIGEAETAEKAKKIALKQPETTYVFIMKSRRTPSFYESFIWRVLRCN